MPLNELAG